MPRIKDLTGKTFGRLLIIGDTGKRDNSRKVLWECLCECENTTYVSCSNLRGGITKSCGCLNKEIVTELVKKIPLEKSIHRGEDNGNWKGGRVVTYEGYVLVNDPKHPNATKQGYVLEHRLIMAQMLGRPLLRDEIVHHANGIRDDNSPENLVLFKNEAAHRTYHGKLKRIVNET